MPQQRSVILRISRPFKTALLLAITYAMVVYLDARTAGNINNGDSNNLANGARVAVDCLRDGIVTSCGAQPGGHSSVFPYPLLQYLPAGLLVLAGATEQTIVTLLAQLNFVAVAAMPIVAWFGFSRRLRPTALFTAAVMASSLTYHSTAAFGEPLSALAILGFSASITQRRLAWTVAFGLLASVSKETLSPVLLLVLAASLLMPDQAARREVTTRRLAIGGAAAIAAGVVINAAFNTFRFGTWRNTMYLVDEFKTDGARRTASYIIGQLVSPSSGVFPFWPVWTLIVVMGIATLATPGQRHSDRVAALCIFASIGVMASSLALWYSPFGGVTLGPRLMVPLLPATAYLMIIYIRRIQPKRFSLVAHCQRWLQRTVTGTVILMAIPTALTASAPWTWSKGIAALIAPSEKCVGILNVPVQTDRAGYFACTDDMMFRLRPSVLRQLWDPSLNIAGTAWIVGTAATLIFLLFGMGLITNTQATSQEAPTRPPSDSQPNPPIAAQDIMP